MKHLSLFLTLLILTPAANAKSWLFVSLLQKKQIVIFEQNSQTGELTRHGVKDCDEEPAAMAVSQDRKTLYVAYRSSQELAAFRINKDTGELQLLNRVPGGDDPAYLLPIRNDQYLLSAYYVSNKVVVHALKEDGSLSAEPLQTVPTAEKAHGIATTAGENRVWVTHTGANRIYQFRFSRRGRLRPLDPPFVATPDGHHPRHIAVHPSGKWAYTSNEAGSSKDDGLSVYSIDSESSSLTEIQSVTSVPADFDASKNSTARCEMTRDGKFVYVANRGHDSIAGYAIDQTTGKAEPLGHFPTESVPRSFTTSADGRFLYAAGQASGRLAAFRISEDGRLERFETYDSGPVSWWAILVED